MCVCAHVCVVWLTCIVKGFCLCLLTCDVKPSFEFEERVNGGISARPVTGRTGSALLPASPTARASCFA